MVLPIIVPLVILVIAAFISIQNDPPADMPQAADAALTGIIKFFESHILDAIISDFAGIIVGAIVSFFTSKQD